MQDHNKSIPVLNVRIYAVAWTVACIPSILACDIRLSSKLHKTQHWAWNLHQCCASCQLVPHQRCQTPKLYQGPLSLTWFNFNPSMDKQSHHTQQSVGWNYLSITTLKQLHCWSWEWISNFIQHFIMDVSTYLCWIESVKTVSMWNENTEVVCRTIWTYRISILHQSRETNVHKDEQTDGEVAGSVKQG